MPDHLPRSVEGERRLVRVTSAEGGIRIRAYARSRAGLPVGELERSHPLTAAPAVERA